MWREHVRELIERAKEELERAAEAAPSIAEEHQHTAIVHLMHAVEIHNDNYRFKLGDDDGTQT